MLGTVNGYVVSGRGARAGLVHGAPTRISRSDCSAARWLRRIRSGSAPDPRRIVQAGHRGVGADVSRLLQRPPRPAAQAWRTFL